MSFADELRNAKGPEELRKERLDREVLNYTNDLVSGVRDACRNAAKHGQSSVSGYFNSYINYDTRVNYLISDYTESRFYITSMELYYELGTFKTTESEVDYIANEVFKNANRELSGDGFSRFALKMEKLPQKVPGFMGIKHRTGRMYYYYWLDISW